MECKYEKIYVNGVKIGLIILDEEAYFMNDESGTYDYYEDEDDTLEY